MNVNQLIAQLRAEQKAGHGKVEVHMLAHDNTLGETQGEVGFVTYFEKSGDDAILEADLYGSAPKEIVYVRS